MHETAKRLLAAGLARGAKDFTEIAKALGGSDQSATNWKKRGVPKAVIIDASVRYSVDVVWLSGSPGTLEPLFVKRWREGTHTPGSQATLVSSAVAQEQRAEYRMPSDEQRLLDGFRVADDGAKRAMLLLAVDALQRFGKRSQNHS